MSSVGITVLGLIFEAMDVKLAVMRLCSCMLIECSEVLHAMQWYSGSLFNSHQISVRIMFSFAGKSTYGFGYCKFSAL